MNQVLELQKLLYGSDEEEKVNH
ncbi:class III lanthipeptide [Shouchella lonarensis]